MTISFIHCADIHLGLTNYDRPNDQGESTRLHDVLNSLDALVNDAIDSEVDLVIIAGDLYKDREPSHTQLQALIDRVTRLNVAEIPTIIVGGNHDLHITPGRRAAIEVFVPIDYRHVTVVTRPTLLRQQTRHGPLNIITLPWQYKSDLRPEYHGTHYWQQALRHQMMQDMARQAQRCDANTPTMVVAHAHIEGSLPGSEVGMTLGTDPMLTPDDFPVQAAYVALGHIHKHQAFGPRGHIVYPGSLARVDFAEERQAKGYVRGTISTDQVAWEHVLVPSREFLTVAWDRPSTDAPLGLEIAAQQLLMAQMPLLPGSILRWHITAPHRDMPLLLQAAERALQGTPRMYQPYAVVPTKTTYTDEVTRDRSITVPEGLSTRDALALYLRASERWPDEHQAVLLRAADRLMGLDQDARPKRRRRSSGNLQKT